MSCTARSASILRSISRPAAFRPAIRRLYDSSNVREVYGHSAEEIYAGGDSWLGKVHPDDLPRIEKAFDELFTRKKPFVVE